MYGLITRHPGELDWTGFDRTFFEVKDASGAQREPVSDAVNTITCFGDTAAVGGDPSLAAVDEEGRPATAERPGLEWSSVCPNRTAYRQGLLALIETCAAEHPDVRLDDVGFPLAGYCHCGTCRERFADADHGDWEDWRAAVVTGFIEAAAERVPGELVLAVHPDPYHGHLRRRTGVDLEAVTPVVDELVVPLYDPAYATTYWLEALAAGFADRFPGRVGVELYAVDVDIDALCGAVRAVEPHVDAVYFGYDAATAMATMRRLRAAGGDGVTHGR